MSTGTQSTPAASSAASTSAVERAALLADIAKHARTTALVRILADTLIVPKAGWSTPSLQVFERMLVAEQKSSRFPLTRHQLATLDDVRCILRSRGAQQ